MSEPSTQVASPVLRVIACPTKVHNLRPRKPVSSNRRPSPTVDRNGDAKEAATSSEEDGQSAVDLVKDLVSPSNLEDSLRSGKTVGSSINTVSMDQLFFYVPGRVLPDEERETIVAFADGSYRRVYHKNKHCEYNCGSIGVFFPNTERCHISRPVSASSSVQTEVLAVALALHRIGRSADVELYTDCRQVILTMNSLHKEPAKTKVYPFEGALYQLIMSRDASTTIHWIKGHSNNYGNEEADMLAEIAAMSLLTTWRQQNVSHWLHTIGEAKPYKDQRREAKQIKAAYSPRKSYNLSVLQLPGFPQINPWNQTSSVTSALSGAVAANLTNPVRSMNGSKKRKLQATEDVGNPVKKRAKKKTKKKKTKKKHDISIKAAPQTAESSAKISEVQKQSQTKAKDRQADHNLTPISGNSTENLPSNEKKVQEAGNDSMTAATVKKKKSKKRKLQATEDVSTPEKKKAKKKTKKKTKKKQKHDMSN